MYPGAALVERDEGGAAGAPGTVDAAVTAPASRNQGQHAHAAQPTPDQSATVVAVASLLLAAGTGVMAAYAIWRLLRGRGVKVARASVVLACTLAERGTNTEPRMVGRSDVARAQRTLEANYRAAYIIAAAQRLTREVPTLARRETTAGNDARAAGATPDEKHRLQAAMRKERRYLEAHEKARKARMAAAVQVAEQADSWGPLLGWHAVNDGHETPECRAADGSNFSAFEPPAIGWPGTPHGGTCRCTPGPPFAGAPTTNEATRHLLTGRMGA